MTGSPSPKRRAREFLESGQVSGKLLLKP